MFKRWYTTATMDMAFIEQATSLTKDAIVNDNIIMSRRRKNSGIRRAMCDRFVSVMEGLELSASEISRELGYSNATTIRSVQRGEAFVDVERLYLLSKLTNPDGKRVNLNWLITGPGPGREQWI